MAWGWYYLGSDNVQSAAVCHTVRNRSHHGQRALLQNYTIKYYRVIILMPELHFNICKFGAKLVSSTLKHICRANHIWNVKWYSAKELQLSHKGGGEKTDKQLENKNVPYKYKKNFACYNTLQYDNQVLIKTLQHMVSTLIKHKVKGIFMCLYKKTCMFEHYTLHTVRSLTVSNTLPHSFIASNLSCCTVSSIMGNLTRIV